MVCLPILPDLYVFHQFSRIIVLRQLNVLFISSFSPILKPKELLLLKFYFLCVLGPFNPLPPPAIIACHKE